ncbi:hypothetical protein B0J12DRAFT_693868 [Macrophomina phaseolina]|uniref:F-box domain-containing protein n=1 Tax=Macrophomina phaseolina TaxID=35725 RepID=A0ABQ8GX03_9PEZI|nr:hypothetical protein B0J12DRAFT_693868 [Macrophomina phaseolina]
MAHALQKARMERARCVPALPEEIWDMITGYTDWHALKQLRLCCRTLSRIAAAYLFRTLYLKVQKDSIERMINIAFHDILRHHVKELVLLECAQLVPFVSWREWYTHIENLADYDDASGSQQSPSAKPTEELPRMYEDYKAECLAMAQFVLCLRQRTCGSKVLGDHYYFTESNEENHMVYACDNFDEALSNFKNLNTVKQRRWWQEPGPLTWRGLRFSVPERRRRQARWANDEDDMLPLTFVLRGLGWAQSTGDSNLKTLDIRTSGIAFWNEYGLRNHLWGSMNNGKLARNCDADVQLMRHSFTNLTRLTCSLAAEEFTVIEIIDSFATFLVVAEGLEDLDLTFTERNGGETISDNWDLFLPLSEQGTRWKKLRRLKLSAYTGGRSLLTFLNNHSSSLRTLTLHDCNLVTPEDSWPELLEQARSVLDLDSVFLLNLFDAYPDRNSDVKGYLIDYMDECEVFAGFKDSIVDYVLKRTDRKPIWDHRPVYDEHLKKCEGCEENRALHDEASADEDSILFEFDLLPIVADLGLL